MKKKLLTLSAIYLLAAFALEAQTPASKPFSKAGLMKGNKGIRAIQKKFSHSPARSVIYSQDFSGGIPGTWSQSPSSPNALWEYRGTGTLPDTGVGSRGAYANTNDPIQSPTYGNGFIIFDSDFLDNNGTPGAFGTGPAPSPHTGILTSDAINCSGHAYVQLSFYQYFRQYSSLTVVGVSTDGLNFVYDTINTSINLNWSTYNNDYIRLDITDVAANSPTVYLQFIFDGASDPNQTGFPGYYFWQIDDIELSDLPQNELVMENNFVNFLNKYGYYNNTPLRQVTPMNFGSAIFNYGSNTQTNVTLGVDVNDGISSLYNKSVSLASSSYGERDTLNIYNPYTPFAAGNYTVGFSLTQNETDTFPGNNDRVSNFMVSDSVYARDNGDTASASSIGSHYYYGTFTFDMKVANLFEVLNTDTVTSISVFLDQGTEVGAQFNLQLLDSSAAHNILLQSDIYTVAAGDINNWVTLVLPPDGVNEILDPNVRYYYAAINILSLTGKVNVADDVTTPQPWYTGLIYIDSTYQAWYSNSNAPFIRMNVKPSAGGLQLPEANFVYETNNLTMNFYDYSSYNPDSWLWEFGDGNTDTSQNPIYTYASPGTYTVCLSVSNAAGGDSVCSAPITLVSIREVEINERIKLYPNPSSGKLIIDAGLPYRDTEAEIHNLIGQKVGHYKFYSDAEKSIDLTNQPNGIYFVKIKTKEGTAIKKMILSR